MILHATSRRNVIIALALIWVLVCGGLSWATWSAVQLDRHEALDEKERSIAAQKVSHAKTLALAVAHLDAIVDATLGPERYRLFEHYRSFYTPANAYDPKDRTELYDPPLLLRSPLQSPTGPDWLLLYFETSAHGWSSPQLAVDEELATPASAIPAADRERQASAENWFAALQERYDPFLLLQEFETALSARKEMRDAFRRYDSTAEKRNDRSGKAANETSIPAEITRTAAEFVRRGELLLKLQRDHFPEEQCKPHLVAMENLPPGGASSTSEMGLKCVWMSSIDRKSVV